MIKTLVSFLVIIPSSVLCLLPMRRQLKYGVQRTVLIMAAFFAITIPTAAFLAFRFALDPNALMLPLSLLCLTAYQLCLNAHISKSLSVFIAVMALLSILSNFASCYDALRNPTLGANSYTLAYSLCQLALSLLALLVLAFPFLKFGSILIDHLNLRRVWYITIPFSLLLLVINLLVRPQQYQNLHVGNISMAAQVVFTGLLLFWLLLVLIYYYIVIGILNAADREQRAKILEMQEMQFIAQQKYMESSARVRHDFRQTLRTLQALSKARDLDGIAAFVDSYAQSLPISETVILCDNRALNALLNYYAQLAAQNHIRIEFSVHLPESLQMTDIDLCTMFGNILENAVNACLRIPEPERFIQLRTMIKNGRQFILVVTNSFDGKVLRQGDSYMSTRQSGNGIGLSSTQAAAERCGGTAEFYNRGKLFYSNVLIPLKPEQRP